MEIELTDGSKFTGTIEQCIAFSKAMGLYKNLTTPKTVYDEKIWHKSESKNQWIRISDMNTVHLRNTILKMLKLWREDVENAKTPQEMFNLLTNLGGAHLTALCKELNTRNGW
jgi:hypothetical protein